MFYIFLDYSNNQEIQESCQATLHSFNHCMFYEPTSYSDDLAEENIHFMEDDIVFKIVIICIATVYILQCRGKLLNVVLFVVKLFIKRLLLSLLKVFISATN